MEERIAQRLIEAAFITDDDTDDGTGWTLAVRYTGLRVTYTWQHENKNWYTVEGFVLWGTIKDAPKNPIKAVLDDLAKQHAEWKP